MAIFIHAEIRASYSVEIQRKARSPITDNPLGVDGGQIGLPRVFLHTPKSHPFEATCGNGATIRRSTCRRGSTARRRRRAAIGSMPNVASNCEGWDYQRTTVMTAGGGLSGPTAGGVPSGPGTPRSSAVRSGTGVRLLRHCGRRNSYEPACHGDGHNGRVRLLDGVPADVGLRPAPLFNA